MKFKFAVKSRGQTMIEVVVAVGVAVMLCVSLITTSLVTQRTARSARNNTQATNLAQEYVEKLRIMRDRLGFDTLYPMISDTSLNCMTINDSGDASTWTLVSCTDPGSSTILDSKTTFWRKIDFTNKTINKINFDVYVVWDDSSGRQTVRSQGILTKWDTQ